MSLICATTGRRINISINELSFASDEWRFYFNQTLDERLWVSEVKQKRILKSLLGRLKGWALASGSYLLRWRQNLWQIFFNFLKFYDLYFNIGMFMFYIEVGILLWVSFIFKTLIFVGYFIDFESIIFSGKFKLIRIVISILFEKDFMIKS